MLVQVSGDGGLSWVGLEVVGPVAEADGGWYQKEFLVSARTCKTAPISEFGLSLKTPGTARLWKLRLTVFDCWPPNVLMMVHHARAMSMAMAALSLLTSSPCFRHGAAHAQDVLRMSMDQALSSSVTWSDCSLLSDLARKQIPAQLIVQTEPPEFVGGLFCASRSRF